MTLPITSRFEAGSDKTDGHSHQTIERILRQFGYHDAEIDAVYFGNWLRDYSQIVDPKLVRAPDMPKAFPAFLSRKALTDLVDVLAVKKFQDLRSGYPAAMQVTTRKLGVYRPSEHIDNPLVVTPPFPNPQMRDPDFEPWVRAGDPLLETDPDTSIKRYLSRSVDYMAQQLRMSMTAPRSLRGLRHFGAALHVLEDLFAHSNFVELSLINAGHDKVLPWTTPMDINWDLPLVTGTFGGSDVVASLAAPLGKILYSTEELTFELTEPEYRSERDKVMLILLSEHPDQSYYKAFNALLSARDQLVSAAQTMGIDTLRFYRWVLSTPASIVINAYNVAAQGVLAWIGNSVADAQTALGNDPNTDPSIEPTHSQLSKDHAEHPLHDLAARLASAAVAQVVQAMLDFQQGKPGADPVAVASEFFCHPAATDWHHTIVNQWAAANPGQIERATLKTDLDQVHQHAILELQDIHRELALNAEQFFDYLFNSTDELPSHFQGLAYSALMAVVNQTNWGQVLLSLTQRNLTETR